MVEHIFKVGGAEKPGSPTGIAYYTYR